VLTAFLCDTTDASGGGQAGWAAYGRVTIPSVEIDATALTIVVTVDITDPELATVAHGGVVTSASGYDILFFAPGSASAYPYVLSSYTASTGRIVANVRIPGPGSDDAVFLVRAGNTAITTDQSNSTATNVPTPDQTISTDLLFAIQASPVFDADSPILIDAPHVQASVTSGGSVDFDVLLPNPGSVVTSAGTPPSGSVAITSTGIRFTAGTDPGTFTWAYSITRGNRADTGYLRAVVSDAGSELPPAVRVVNVTTQGQFTSAITVGTVAAGDQIVLAAGLSVTGFTIPSSGWPATSANPIVIKAASALGATVTGDVTVNGSDTYLWGLKHGAHALKVTGARVQTLRCQFLAWSDTSGEGPQITIAGADCAFGYNEQGNIHAGRGLRLRPQDGCVRPHVYRNWWHDMSISAPLSYNECVQCGDGKGTTDLSCQALIEYNYIENCLGNIGRGDENENISVKSSDNTIQFNTLINSRLFMNRHGERNTWAGNYSEGAQAGFGCRDRGTIYLGNKAVGGLGCRLEDGDVSPTNWPKMGQYVAADATKLVGNDFSGLIVGDGAHSLPCTNTVIMRNLGAAPTLQHQSGTTQPAYDGTAYPAPIKLRGGNASPPDVGPFASVGGGTSPGNWSVVWSDPGTSGLSGLYSHRGAGDTDDTNTGSGILLGCSQTNQLSSQTLWSRQLFAFPARVSFDVTIQTSPTTVAGNLAILLATGVGDVQHPTDFAAWAGLAYSDTEDQDGASGVWFNFGFRGSAVDLNVLKMRTVPGYVQILPSSPADFPFPNGQRFSCRITVDNNTAIFLVTNTTTGASESFTWTDASIGGYSACYLGLRARCIDAYFANMTVEQKS
jgi:hypothetical protein